MSIIDTPEKLQTYMNRIGVPKYLQEGLSSRALYDLLTESYGLTVRPSVVASWCKKRDGK